MGMAASQARFLGLTARKSNVEYQVQQINQQRTSLANESAGLYNQMMELSVPTPPSVNDFYTTKYVLDGSGGDEYLTSDYEIANLTKTYGSQGEYLISLSSKKDEVKSIDEIYYFKNRTVTEKTPDSGEPYSVYSFSINKKDTSTTTNITYDPTASAYKAGSTSIDNLVENQIYPIEEGKVAPNGYEESGIAGEEGNKYFYYDKNAEKYIFLTQANLDAMINNDTSTTDDDMMSFMTTYTYSKETITQVKGSIETSSNGRLTSVTINNDESYSEDLRGKTFSLSAVQEYDEAAYTQAMNDYEFEKGIYEKAMSDINAQTEAIQAKDQSLELKIQQLDTEQNAISTEMDSVKKVIEDNVEKTFKIFA